jgi:hypothetical protein
VTPFVIFGHPDARTVRDLIFKRGFGCVKRERVPLTDNTVIEEALGADNMYVGRVCRGRPCCLVVL